MNRAAEYRKKRRRSIAAAPHAWQETVHQANYGAGLRIIDIGDIDRPMEVGFLDTVPHDDDVPAFDLGAWTAYPYFDSGIIAVSSGSEGLFLLRYAAERPVSE